MAVYQFPYADLNKVLGAVSKKQTIYLPVDTKEGESVFKEWTDGIEMSRKLNTVRSAKDFFFPQVQPLVKFRRAGQKIEIFDQRKESEDFVIFGARACDVRSFTVLDNVFLADPVDTQYQTRREHATVVTLACSRPAETCFCGTFDVRAWIAGDTFYLEPLTKKGEAFVEEAKDVMTDGDEAKVEEAVSAIRTIMDRLPLASLKAADNTKKELELFNSDKWAELASHCIGCGACTFVCMYHDFTMMAAGTPRKTQKERFRQRFMHKLVYYPIQHDGMFSCVGCGRCLKKCPIQMNIVKVMKTLEVTE